MGWKKLILFWSLTRNEATEVSDRSYLLVRNYIQLYPVLPGFVSWIRIFSTSRPSVIFVSA